MLAVRRRGDRVGRADQPSGSDEYAGHGARSAVLPRRGHRGEPRSLFRRQGRDATTRVRVRGRTNTGRRQPDDVAGTPGRIRGRVTRANPLPGFATADRSLSIHGSRLPDRDPTSSEPLARPGRLDPVTSRGRVRTVHALEPRSYRRGHPAAGWAGWGRDGGGEEGGDR